MAARIQKSLWNKTLLPALILTGILAPWPRPASAQEKPSSLVKAGYLPLAFSKYYGHDYSLHFEIERNFRKAEYLSQGIGYDYKHFNQYERFNFIRYKLNFYPLYWLYGKRPFRGIYIGISPAFHWRKFYQTETLSGLGIIPYLGTQFLIGDKVSLAFDMNIYAFRDLWEDFSNNSDHQIYMDAYFSFKIGLKLGGGKK